MRQTMRLYDDIAQQDRPEPNKPARWWYGYCTHAALLCLVPCRLSLPYGSKLAPLRLTIGKVKVDGAAHCWIEAAGGEVLDPTHAYLNTGYPHRSRALSVYEALELNYTPAMYVPLAAEAFMHVDIARGVAARTGGDDGFECSTLGKIFQRAHQLESRQPAEDLLDLAWRRKQYKTY